jgi:glycosyltransferase involved in cell wall biosynthesis
MPYITYCIKTIIEQDYEDYEIIISDDNSSDETHIYLQTLEHPRILIIRPPYSMSMTEHWEWALKHAKGDWLIFVGQDDGLQNYFFKLADELVAIAETKKIRSISSDRAYFFWPGCKDLYGDISVSYIAKNKIEICSSLIGSIKALLSIQSYFYLPQMYTTSLFKRSLIEEARKKQGGIFLKCHPQDANLAAISCGLEKRYLNSRIPLGWVGTSPKSAGMAITFASRDKDINKDLNMLEADYKKRISESPLQYDFLAGDFSMGDPTIYFWQALINTEDVGNKFLIWLIKSTPVKIIIFGIVLNNLNLESRYQKIKPMFNELLRRNSCKKIYVYLVSYLAFFFTIFYILFKIVRKIVRLVSFSNERIVMSWADNNEMNIISASLLIKKRIVDKRKWIR